MKKHFVFLFALAALLFFTGGRTAHAMPTEPYVTWDPQSVQFPVGSDAEYAATVSGKDLEFTWFVEYGGKDYEIPAQLSQLMAAGMKNECDGVAVTSAANRTSIVFRNIKATIGYHDGKPTRVYCHAFDGNTGVDTNYAHVGCSGLELKDCGYPPRVYVRPVVNLKPDDTGKIGMKIIGVDESLTDDMTYQWYSYTGGPYTTGLKAISDADSPIYISATDPGEFEDVVAGIRLTTKGGLAYWIYSSPININRLSGDIDYSWDQLRIVRTPDRLGYTLGDKPDLTGLEAEYIAGGKSQGIVPITSLETDIDSFTYAGPVRVTVGYKGETNGFTVWVDPKDGSWELDPAAAEPTTEAPTTEEPATTAEGPTTAEVSTTAEEPTQPEATETAAETSEPAPETTGTESTSAPAPVTTENVPATSADAPVPTTEAAPQGGSSGNTVLIVLIIVMALIIGLLAGVLISRKNAK